MREVQRGSRDAFGVLVARHVDALYAYALRLSQHPATAEDMVQETWLTLWQKARSYNPHKARVSTWLHRILHNRYIDGRRRERPEAMTSLDEAYEPAAAATGADSLAQLNKLVDELPLNQKSALTLTYLQGFSNRETAEIMGMSVRAVESLLARARAALHAGRETPGAQSALDETTA